MTYFGQLFTTGCQLTSPPDVIEAPVVRFFTTAGVANSHGSLKYRACFIFQRGELNRRSPTNVKKIRCFDNKLVGADLVLGFLWFASSTRIKENYPKPRNFRVFLSLWQKLAHMPLLTELFMGYII